MSHQSCPFWITPSISLKKKHIWVNYNISLTWIKAIWGWFPLLTMIPVRSQWGRYNLPRHILYMFMMVLSPWNDWYDNPPRTGPLPVSFLDLLRQAFEELVTCDIWVPCWVLLGWYPDIYGKSMENLLQIHLKKPPDLDFGDLSMNHRTSMTGCRVKVKASKCLGLT